jgi:hypothetical protein
MTKSSASSVRASVGTARVGNRRSWLLSALCAHTKPPYETDLPWRSLRPLTRLGRAQTAEERDRERAAEDAVELRGLLRELGQLACGTRTITRSSRGWPRSCKCWRSISTGIPIRGLRLAQCGPSLWIPCCMLDETKRATGGPASRLQAKPNHNVWRAMRSEFSEPPSDKRSAFSRQAPETRSGSLHTHRKCGPAHHAGRSGGGPRRWAASAARRPRDASRRPRAAPEGAGRPRRPRRMAAAAASSRAGGSSARRSAGRGWWPSRGATRSF